MSGRSEVCSSNILELGWGLLGLCPGRILVALRREVEVASWN